MNKANKVDVKREMSFSEKRKEERRCKNGL